MMFIMNIQDYIDRPLQLFITQLQGDRFLKTKSKSKHHIFSNNFYSPMYYLIINKIEAILRITLKIDYRYELKIDKSRITCIEDHYLVPLTDKDIINYGINFSRPHEFYICIEYYNEVDIGENVCIYGISGNAIIRMDGMLGLSFAG
jgi:hypothetical protein